MNERQYMELAKFLYHYRESPVWGNASSPTRREEAQETAIRMAMSSLAYDIAAMLQATDAQFDNDKFMKECGL